MGMREAWNQISEHYQARYQIGTSKIHYGPLCPTEDRLKLLGKVAGKNILELGSGAAQNSIYLSKHGANTTAVDISDSQLTHAKKLAEENGVQVKFIQSDFVDFKKKVGRQKYDIVLSVYALQYCQSVAEMRGVMKNIASVLKPKGFLLFSLDHPIRAHGYWQVNKGSDIFVLDNYFDRSAKKWNYSFPEGNIAPEMTGSFKTIGDYIVSVIDAGLVIQKVLEPEPVEFDANSNFGKKSQYGVDAQADPYSYDHLSRVPGTLIIKATKS